LPILTDVNRIRKEPVKCPRENERQPDSIPVFEVRRLETTPRQSRSYLSSRTQPSSRYRKYNGRFPPLARRSLCNGCRPHTPVKRNHPPQPFAFGGAILSRIRSSVTSRSNWAKDSKTLSVGASYRSRCVERLGDSDERDSMRVKHFDHLGEVGERPG
jgi:hypothetical protein